MRTNADIGVLMRTFAYFSAGIFHNAGKADITHHKPTKAYIPMGIFHNAGKADIPLHKPTKATIPMGIFHNAGPTQGWEPGMITVGGKVRNTVFKWRIQIRGGTREEKRP